MRRAYPVLYAVKDGRAAERCAECEYCDSKPQAGKRPEECRVT